MGLSLDTVETHPVLGEGIHIQSQVCLTTKPMSPTFRGLSMLAHLVFCESGDMYLRTRPLSVTLPTSLAPLTKRERTPEPWDHKEQAGPTFLWRSKDHLAHSISHRGLGFSSSSIAGGKQWPFIFFFNGNFFWEVMGKASTRTFLLVFFGLQEPSM